MANSIRVYGCQLRGKVKRYLTESVTLIRIHRFCPADVQFDDALVSSAVLVFEKRSPEPNHTVAISFGGTLIQPNMKDDVSLDELRMAKKWTRFPRQGRDTSKRCTVTLGDLFTVKRGLATGNNEFFIVPRERLHRGSAYPSVAFGPSFPARGMCDRRLLTRMPMAGRYLTASYA